MLLAGCSSGSSAPTRTSPLDAAISSVSTARAHLLSAVDATQAAATALDRTDALCVKGQGQAARRSFLASQPLVRTARQGRSRLVTSLPSYTGALQSLQRASTEVDGQKRLALARVVRDGRAEATAIERFRGALAGLWPAYDRLLAAEDTWSTRAVGGWYRTTAEGAAAYAVLVGRQRPALQAARQALAAAVTALQGPSETQSATLAAADQVLGAKPQVSKGRACTVSSNPGDSGLAQQVLRECEAAVPRVTAVWGSRWSRSVELLLAGSGELAALVPGGGDLTKVAALVSGQQVYVNAEPFRLLSAAGRRVVITHELTHLATGPSGRSPAWVSEGFADYVGHSGAGLPVAEAAQELASDVRAGRVPTGLPTDSDFTDSAAARPQAYAQSWLAVSLLARNHGVPALVRFVRQVRDGDTDRVMRAVFGTSVAAFTASWRAELRRSLA